ncbi:MAG: TSUP family transporter [Desulfovibrio sp.]|nr:TSUP family transporter [Desulfovibrio sp.]
MFVCTLGIYAFGIAAAFVGGFIDSIAGGGGLVTMPALLLSGVPPHMALGCNKVSACLGTLTALGNFARSGLVHWRVAMTGVAFALLGSWAGSQLALHLNPDILGKILVVLLPVGMCAVLLPHKAQRPSLPAVAPLAFTGVRFWIPVALVCLLIGSYDGFFGPGTGSFLILALHWALRMGLMEASATAKVLNLASNFSGTLVFICGGVVFWPLALSMAAACCLGNWLGSRMAIRIGPTVVRRFLTVSLSLLLLTLVWQHFLAPLLH